MKRNLEVITELKKQGKALLDARREEIRKTKSSLG